MPKDRSIADQLESSEYGVLSLKRHPVEARSFGGIFLVFISEKNWEGAIYRGTIKGTYAVGRLADLITHYCSIGSFVLSIFGASVGNV